MTDDRLILLGRIVGLYGVQGWVRLESWTEPRMQIFSYQPWLLKTASAEREFRGSHGREQGKGVVAQLPGVADRDEAAAWIGAEIRVRRSVLPRPKKDEYYWVDLEGLAVVTVDGASLGTVSHLIATGANDVLFVVDGEKERLIPFVTGPFVKEVDFEARRIVVDWDPEF